ncbi:hypothetical protein I5G59_gp40 [Mycobacterium phage LilMcDreamy]|uniref:Uncharacterized protein n=1 Tax=Mycobacterium phage LilMcDreamy TaxID=2652422 RepID=A0A5P8D994_9CAUD|nr:hypothetical protein I5G59_gp40 [Mycobacterium phage LilMcDreamy]QFP94660.1 hypothetical protein SEA_LILMCDREAMY_40 [Mycobacterium phage LilMcDreamy]
MTPYQLQLLAALLRHPDKTIVVYSATPGDSKSRPR